MDNVSSTAAHVFRWLNWFDDIVYRRCAFENTIRAFILRDQF